MNKPLNIDQAIGIVVKSRFLVEVIEESVMNELEQSLPNYHSLSLIDILEKIPDLEYCIEDIKQEKFLSLRIVSDDEGGSECGPWHVDVYGACGVWAVFSVEFDDLWFSDRASAISAAYDYAHGEIIETIDYEIAEYQIT